VFIRLLLLRYIVIELLLFLLDPSMVNLLEVPLLAELVVGGASLLSEDARFIELVLHHSELVRELAIHAVDLRDVRQL
jgi:hypothetical protein